jgi:hypothetical protein
VRKGRVMLEGSHTKVKGGNKVVFSGSSFSVAKLENADKKDTLEAWSKDRAQTLAKANSRISGRTLTTLYASFRHDWAYPGLGRPFWLFNTDIGCYTLIPFGFGWESPYGSSYSRFFYGGYGYGSPYCCGRGPTHGSPVVTGGVGGYPTGPGVGGSGGPVNPPSQGSPRNPDSPMMGRGKPDVSPGGDGPAIRPPNKE